MWHAPPCFSSAHRHGMPMELSARLFNCARCHRQVVLCRRCDRGNVYCPDGCAILARRASLRRANARYRATRCGRLNNAERQRRFRARQQKVTHHGSDPIPGAVPLAVSEPASASWSRRTVTPCRNTLRCDQCGQPVSDFLRNDFLRSTVRPRDPPRAHR